jgi:hypothetical protein
MAGTKVIRSACFLILFIVAGTPIGMAENIHVGSLAIHPYVSASAGHTDNLYLTETEEISDTFYLISPGVRLLLPFRKHVLSLDYTLDHYKYTDQDNADRTVHNVTGSVALNPWRTLNIQFQDLFTRSADPPDFEGDQAHRFVWNWSSVEATYDITRRLALGVGYEYAIKRYDRSLDRVDDYDDNGLSGRFYMRILPKTSLVVAYTYRNREYEERPREDSDANRLEGGITWDIGAKSSGTVLVGYMRTDYPRLDRTDSALSYSINLTHQLRPKTTLSLEGVRAILDTSFADRNLVFSNAYVSTQISGNLTHRYRKFTGRLKAGYIQDEYLYDDVGVGKKRKDQLFRGEFGIDYALRKWLRFGGSYRYTRRDSNFDGEEYQENLFLVTLSLIL